MGFRTHGKSKDSRDDLPQVVIGMAVTRDGIPVRVWCWPGNTADSPLIRQVKDELRDWTLGRVIWVADRGFTSAANRRHLAAGADGYILGEKLRSGSPEAAAALSRQGRYQQVAENLRVKEVKVGEHERFVVCHNPDAAERDAATRERLVAQFEAMIDGSDCSARDETGRAARGDLDPARPEPVPAHHPRPGCCASTRRRSTADAKLDGKYLLRTNDPRLSGRGHRPRLQAAPEVERGWRDMKRETRRLNTALDLPLPPRIPAPGHRTRRYPLTSNNTHHG